MTDQTPAYTMRSRTVELAIDEPRDVEGHTSGLRPATVRAVTVEIVTHGSGGGRVRVTGPKLRGDGSAGGGAYFTVSVYVPGVSSPIHESAPEAPGWLTALAQAAATGGAL